MIKTNTQQRKRRYSIITFEHIDKNANGSVTPAYAHDGDSGMDIFIPTKHNGGKPFKIEPGERVLIPTGLRTIFNKNFELQIRSKSGLSLKKGIVVLNSPGTIEYNYRGELGVILYNTNRSTSIELEPGMAIAQAVLCPVVNSMNHDVTIMEKTYSYGKPLSICTYRSPEEEDKSNAFTRGEGGFGSSVNSKVGFTHNKKPYRKFDTNINKKGKSSYGK